MSSTNVREFTLDMTRLAKALPEETVLVAHKKLTFDALETLVARTPVGNPDLWAANQGKTRGEPGYVGVDYLGGHARANWQVGVDGFPEGEVPGVDVDGAATIEREAAKLDALEPFGLTVIANNVPYIEALEDGHSTQAPIGIVEITVAELQASIEFAT